MRAVAIVRLFTALLLWTASGGAVGHAQSAPDLAPEGEQLPDATSGPEQTAAGDESSAPNGIDDERARSHFAAGESHYAAGRFGDAAREFALAYELSRRPEMLVNLARAHEKDGALRAAVADLELLLAQHPSTSYRGEAEERIARMRAALAEEEAREADVAAPPQALPPVREPQEPKHPRTLRMLGFGLAAGALAAAAVAIGTGVRAHQLYLDLEGDCPGDRCEGEFVERRDRGKTLARASTAMTFLSIALGAGAATSLLLDRRARRQTSVALELTPRHAGMSLRRTF